MATSKMFVHYSGTIDQFKALSNIAEYNNKIVFIKGGNDGKGAAIYTHGEYYTTAHDIEAAVASLKIIKGVQVNSDASTIKTATDHNGIINFTNGDETVAISADGPGITISVSKPFQNRVSAVETTVKELKGTGTGSVSDQITSAVNALKGTLDDTDATTLEAINDELNAIQTNYIAKSDLATEASDDGGTNVKVTVKTQNGKVSDVSVDETALIAALNLKANAADVYDKTGAETMAQSKVNALANGAVKDNTDAIRILNGSDTGKSAREIVQDEVSRQLNSEKISDSFDTLKEMAEWLSSHPQDVTDMQNSIQHILNDYLNSSDKEEIQNIIIENERVTAETYNDLDDRLIALEGKNATIDSALQAADIITGSDNGTISVKGSDVAVKGLASAAYTEASAYATAAQGAKADAAAPADSVYTKTEVDAFWAWEEF